MQVSGSHPCPVTLESLGMGKRHLENPTCEAKESRDTGNFALSLTRPACSFIQTFIEHLLCARHHGGSLGYISEQIESLALRIW